MVRVPAALSARRGHREIQFSPPLLQNRRHAAAIIGCPIQSNIFE